MTGQIVVLGYGPVGKAATEIMVKQGRTVVVAQRSAPRGLSEAAGFQRCDVLDGASVRNCIANASQVVLAIGLPYDGQTWKQRWPKVMTNLIEACAEVKARLVFVDNLYMYGPQNSPLTEDMALTSYGIKPKVRAEVTRLWMAARDSGQVRVAAVRGPDFYGPQVTLSHLGGTSFGALAKGRAATLLIPPDTPHDFAYVPDFGRAVATLIDAPDEDFGQAWHVPCAPTQTARQILELGAAALAVPLRVRSIPFWMVRVAGLISPMMREVAEMGFTFDRPYHVDAGKFMRRFWSDPTPFSVGAPATALSFRAR